MINRLLAIALLCAVLPATADELRIPVGSQGSAEAEARLPSRGMTMDTVAAKWGEPAERHAAVGEPPITRWDYGEFSVYFEGNLVLHSVIRHERASASP